MERGGIRLNRGYLAASVIVALAIVLTLFASWEPTTESWGYWYLARVFAETGRAPILDKGPAYVIYLAPFQLLGHPASVIAEYLVTTGVLAAALIIMLRRPLGVGVATVAVIAWLPYLQSAEPPNQKLALACVLFASATHRSQGRRTLTYGLLALAYLLRSPFALFAVAFLFHDVLVASRSRTWIRRPALRLSADVVPLVVAGLVFVWTLTLQSSDPWNNVFFASTQFSPASGKSWDGTFIHDYNMEYNFEKLGTYEGPDFFITNRDLFGGASTIFDAIRANPSFVVATLVRHFRTFVHMVTNLAGLRVPLSILPYAPVFIFLVFVTFVVGAFRGAASSGQRKYVVGALLTSVPIVVAFPAERFLPLWLPVLILSAWAVGSRLVAHRSVGGAAAILVLSIGPSLWFGDLDQIRNDLAVKQLHPLERKSVPSMAASFGELSPLLERCAGVMTLEATFIAAYSGLPRDRVHDVWEVPPYTPSDYEISPTKVDCLLISRELSTGIGSGTNWHVRYETYIVPYAERLKDLGATTLDVPRYGRAIILHRSDR